MASSLPTLPRIVFTIIEPISLVAGFLGPLVSPQFFAASQLATTKAAAEAHELTATEHILALQLGNAYLLLGFLGVFILNTTLDLPTVRAYLAALWLGDIGHVLITAWGLGLKGTFNIFGWNAVTWGNIGFTVMLFALRSLYFLGVFDKNGAKKGSKSKQT
ncbi:hypothetical protein BFW01_g3528 [Lasiodiplodia theobromae]|uniref:DUF7704 domain-containing protein n=1 Tax=Lasiodiplodia theobromae TaxID=45133 RepID=A0A5N5DRL4_9PEZI|nr:uncharacterized protein LTHEOB_8767 [Lasiodiplodia theobromae]KAB2580596.1 hypothetical protein DBV05_g1045 [Lasiodiplodia theobromae]KAF4541371.1 hypothetical protein LTHEOB_8767 [Lasiodiplodia theobromae]KAF9632665.1 hypothetical protein BFW01_g3528 [Lasiodiplodia theobromae]